MFLCKSLGFYTSASKSGPNCWAVRISGPVSKVPVVLDRKKATRDNHRNTGCSTIKITKVSDSGRYYGITVNKDERYVLGNFVVTHNTGIPSQMDAIIGVGGNAQYDKADMRHLSMCKNKVGAGKRWDKAFKIDRGTSSVLESV